MDGLGRGRINTCIQVPNPITFSRLLLRTSPSVRLRRVTWSPTLFPTWAYILTVFRREVKAKEIDVAVVTTFDAKSSEAEEILVHHTEDK